MRRNLSNGNCRVNFGMKLLRGDFDQDTDSNNLKQPQSFHINAAHVRFTPPWKAVLRSPGAELIIWMIPDAAAVLPTPLPRASSYPLGVSKLTHPVCSAVHGEVGSIRQTSTNCSLRGSTIAWGHQARAGRTAGDIQTGKKCKTWYWEPVEQINSLSHFLTPSSWHRAPQAKSYPWDFSEASFTPRGAYWCVAHNTGWGRAPGVTWKLRGNLTFSNFLQSRFPDEPSLSSALTTQQAGQDRKLERKMKKTNFI